VDRALADLIDRCLAIDPEKRYPNVQAVLDALSSRDHSRARRPLLILGAVGPILILIALALTAGGLFRSSYKEARGELIRRAVEGNRFAARLVAERFAGEIEKRWGILEQEATDPQLVQWLERGPELLEDEETRQAVETWLQARLNRYNESYFTPETAAARWFINDAEGYQLGIAPWGDSVGENTAYRDYFHGLGRELAQDVSPRPRPITEPHRSNVYESISETHRGRLTVAFSVPVWGVAPPEGDGPEREPVGILAMAADLGNFISLQGSSNQFPILIDTRADAAGHRGLVVVNRNRELQLLPMVTEENRGYLDDSPVRTAALERAEEPVKDAVRLRYSDFPADGETLPASPTGQEWLGSLIPVVAEWGGQPKQTGFVILVLEEASAVQPMDDWGGKVLGWGAVALGVVVLLTGALWGFVIVVLGPTRRTGVVGFLQRRIGLRSGPSSRPSDSGSGRGSGASARGHGLTPTEREGV
jgi:hypothetical protein